MVERKSYVNNDESIVIPGWMINQFFLRGNDLLIFAIIYGHTKDGESWFAKSEKYLADWCNASKPGIHVNLKKLVEADLLEKSFYWNGNKRMVKYRVNLNKTKSYLRG